MWRLGPLLPEHSYRLFMERARERSPKLIPDEDTEAAILGNCAKVDQLPLGIELTADRSAQCRRVRSAPARKPV